MKKILSIVLVMIIGLSLLAGCSKKEVKENTDNKEVASEKDSKKDEKKPLKIGVIYLTAEHPYYQAHAMHTQNYTAEKGIKLIELDGKVDQANMANQMENLVSQKVDGIIYCLLEGTAGSADINMAQEAGIPVITFAIKHDPKTADATFVGIDEKSAGALGGVEAANKFMAQFPDKKAKIAVIEMTGVSASTDRSDGFIEGFQSVITDAEVVVRLNGEGKKDKAMAVVEDAIQANPDINVFFGANGDQGLGALAALEAQGRGTIDTEIVISHDGSEPELLKIADPESALKIANANLPKDLAEATVDTILEIINGEREMKNTDDIFVPSAVITGDDIEAAQKFLKEQYNSDTQL
ncbi:sugar ABC transporter substrate-binding protein [Vallitalea guaymasensis]|uniref:sugar ABC transporter substrate-binding protein n=1 Tax=Vallitalea guaymasensis TaxID=1185412 RepID=UPI000DE53E04|nr:sugar ABC transporter substrate-binding protein [Vallitalea guaymasensis]